MKIIINNIIPFKGYKAMTIYPFIFARRELKDVDVTHEFIHGEQQKETLIIFFLLIYAIEYIIKLIITRSHKRAYKAVSFEQEAYEFEQLKHYFDYRKRYNWIRYIFSLNYYGS